MMAESTEAPFSDLSHEEIAAYASRLQSEIDAELRSDRWVLLSEGPGVIRIHTGAALWHGSELLQDVVSAVEAEREMALRIIGRALLEACLIGFYLHYGGLDAMEAIESDMKATLLAQQHEADRYDAALASEIKSVRKWNRKVRKENPGRVKWNEGRSSTQDPLPLLSEKPEPKRPKINLDLSIQLGRFSETSPGSLTIPTVVHRINELAKEKAPGEQNFGVIYTIGFRTLSTIGPHTNLQVLQSYFPADWSRNFLRLQASILSPSYADTAENTSLALVALLAKFVLGDVPGASTPVTDEILRRFEGASAHLADPNPDD